jgi:phage anti-repressor protein
LEETEELKQAKMQTPIEIALGVDENGMTTAKKLYEFLEMDKSHYSRWAKANIVDNEFATENEDYFYSPSMANESSRGNFADDYKLTAHFAKKLSMKGNGEKAEEAREYFTHLEERMKQKVIEMIGTVVFLFCICIDATEYPVTAIPVLIGLLLIYIGTKIDGEWQEYTEEIVDYDYRSESDDDDGITYITFDTDYSKEKESSEPTKAE